MKFTPITLCFLVFTSCANSQIIPPVAPKNPMVLEKHGTQRTDNYFWLKDKTNPEVINYIKAENDYTEKSLAPTKPLQETIYKELRGRIKEDSTSVPYYKNGYYYYDRTETGKNYPINCRKKGSIKAREEIMFDQNDMAKGKAAFIFVGYSVSSDNKTAAYFSNDTGSFADAKLRFRNLETGKDFDDEIPSTAGFAWANDSKTYFYIVPDQQTLRPNKLYRSRLGKADKELVLEETDEQQNLSLSDSRTGKYIVLNSAGFSSSETHIINANQPQDKPQVFLAKQKDVRYSVEDHKDYFLVLYHDKQNKNFKVSKSPLTLPTNQNQWRDLVPHNPLVQIDSIEVFQNFLALSVHANGLPELHTMNLKTETITKISFPEAVYEVAFSDNHDYRSEKLRYSYSSLNRPGSIYDYDLNRHTSTLLQQIEIPSGFDPDTYVVKRLWATSYDGTTVPVSVVHKKDLVLDGANPAMLTGYGSYGYSYSADFNSNIFSLVDRGFVFAIGHPRGGSEMGTEWYESGKLMKKKNTFHDFIAVAEKLIQDGYTSPKRLAISGGSAGGLLMGAVINMRPDLFGAVVAQVPFVDVLTTMLDPTLPLTLQEYEQWGNPNEKEPYEYIRSYSPYDNIKAQAYPSMLVTGGINDSQVLFHEPTKWVAKLRAHKTDSNPLYLKINMNSGHGGDTGRFDRLKEVATEYVFVLGEVGK